MRYVFLMLAVPTALGALLVLLKTLTGTAAGPRSLSGDVVAVVASLAVLALLGGALHLALNADAPGVATALVPLSWLLFAVCMGVHGLLATKAWN
jgi:hypothetical protein